MGEEKLEGEKEENDAKYLFNRRKKYICRTEGSTVVLGAVGGGREGGGQT